LRGATPKKALWKCLKKIATAVAYKPESFDATDKWQKLTRQHPQDPHKTYASVKKYK
jgi:hypothetical protein